MYGNPTAPVTVPAENFKKSRRFSFIYLLGKCGQPVKRGYYESMPLLFHPVYL
jgi:hypothetical protein